MITSVVTRYLVRAGEYGPPVTIDRVPYPGEPEAWQVEFSAFGQTYKWSFPTNEAAQEAASDLSRHLLEYTERDRDIRKQLAERMHTIDPSPRPPSTLYNGEPPS